MWIARNSDGSLRLYEDKPIKGIILWYDGWFNGGYPIKSNLFPEVTWNDDEPREIVLK